MFIEPRVGGLDFLSLTPEKATEFVIDEALSPSNSTSSRNLHLICASSFYFADRDAHLRRIFETSWFNFADGKYISLFGRLRGTPLEQVRGPGLFAAVLDRGRDRDLSHYFIGGTVMSLAKLQVRAAEMFPGVRIAGVKSPHFQAESEEEVIEMAAEIRQCSPSIVWLGMSTPRQDFLAFRLSLLLKVPVIAVGAAFDFLSGAQKEAPEVLRSLGMEWLYRFACNPARLWRRYLVGNLVFLKIMIRNHF